MVMALQLWKAGEAKQNKAAEAEIKNMWTKTLEKSLLSLVTLLCHARLN